MSHVYSGDNYLQTVTNTEVLNQLIFQDVKDLIMTLNRSRI